MRRSKMKACVLAYKTIKQSKPLYLKLIKEMKRRFKSVMLIPIDNVVIEMNKGIKVMYRNLDISDFDIILPRIGPSYVPFGHLILKHLEGEIYHPNNPEAYLVSSNKFHTLMVLHKHGLPVPKTLLTISKDLAKTMFNKVGEPIIIKKLGKSGGKGVVYAKDVQSATTFLDAIPLYRGEQLLIEEYIKNPGEDIRFFVVGDEVVACMKRIAKKSDIRSNIHAGGKGVPFQPTEEMRRNAVKAAKVIGAEICGIDMIIGPKGPEIIECNMNPGFQISKVTGKNVFKSITDFLYKESKLFHQTDERSIFEKVGEPFRNIFRQIEKKF